jgi:hypothetical protein
VRARQTFINPHVANQVYFGEGAESPSRTGITREACAPQNLILFSVASEK